MFPFRIYINPKSLKNNDLVQVIPVKLINLFYNINPSFLNYFYHIDYPNLFRTYWLTGFFETNLTYLSINFNNLTLPLQKAAPEVPPNEGAKRLCLTEFLIQRNAKFGKSHKLKKYPSLNWILNFGGSVYSPTDKNFHPKLTYIKFEFHLYDNNLYNLLLLNKLFKGKILLINHTYKLILKYNFGEIEIKQILEYLDNYPFLSSKYLMYLKLRIIYRRCQRKENYYHKGIQQILRVFE